MNSIKNITFDLADNDFENVITISHNIKKKKIYHVIKRVLDIFFAIISLVILSPVFLTAAIAIKLDSKGSVLYKQYRVGKNGKKFMMYKFRSMCADADKKLQSLYHLNEKTGPIFKMSNDPRITKVGHILRKTSIDELPQLINILKGEMAIVGPRPPLENEVKQYTAYQAQRLCVTPGLTCYWQISGRSNISFQDWVELDIKYINESCLLTDLKIILKTIPAVIMCTGAY